jgi:PTS hybrid protein
MTEESPLVGVIAVSHSRRIAEGVVELARQMAGDDVRLEGVGGQPDGSIGTDADGIAAAIQRAQSGVGVVVVADLGSAILATESALELLGPERAGPVIMSTGPLVEGAVVAAVQASIGQSMEEVVAAADAARDLDKGVSR